MYDLRTPGILIAVEGIDGAGSSTLAAGLTAAMNARGLKTFLTKEPTDNLIGGLVRGFLTNEWAPSPRVRQILFAADRGHHLYRMVLPALLKGHHVVTDRYLWSTLAFGMVDIDLVELEQYNQAYPWPDITFLVDIEADVTQKRLQERDKMQLFEGAKTQKSVRENYLALIQRYPERITLLDGKLRPERLVEEALQAVLSHPAIVNGRRFTDFGMADPERYFEVYGKLDDPEPSG